MNIMDFATAHRAERVQAYLWWEGDRADKLAAMPPAVAASVRETAWRAIVHNGAPGIAQRDVRDATQRAISRERVRRHGALDTDTAAAQHAAIRADWGIA